MKFQSNKSPTIRQAVWPLVCKFPRYPAGPGRSQMLPPTKRTAYLRLPTSSNPPPPGQS